MFCLRIFLNLLLYLPEYFTKERLDNSCLPAMIAIAVTQFHNLTEVQDNAR